MSAEKNRVNVVVVKQYAKDNNVPITFNCHARLWELVSTINRNFTNISVSYKATSQMTKDDLAKSNAFLYKTGERIIRNAEKICDGTNFLDKKSSIILIEICGSTVKEIDALEQTFPGIVPNAEDLISELVAITEECAGWVKSTTKSKPKKNSSKAEKKLVPVEALGKDWHKPIWEYSKDIEYIQL